jgi:mannose-1-phosphate guanylyltransferase / mannose-6-phosphate isomerase
MQEKSKMKETRPWGKFEIILIGKNFQVKILTVNPGAKLSLQSHDHREEHWVIVQGIAEITNGNEKRILEKSAHIFIPVGNKHRIENPGNDFLEIIETQIGDYLGEDDIVRYEDIYARL